jgi:hypothetical protein
MAALLTAKPVKGAAVIIYNHNLPIADSRDSGIAYFDDMPF